MIIYYLLEKLDLLFFKMLFELVGGNYAAICGGCRIITSSVCGDRIAAAISRKVLALPEILAVI